VLLTSFPVSLRQDDYYRDGVFDVDRYNRTLREQIDSLDVTQRIRSLRLYYEAQPRNGYFIFEVEGLKGDCEFTIGPVNFYSPQIKRYVRGQDGHSREIEFFNRTDERYLNAAVEVTFIDAQAAQAAAVEKLEKALDLLRFFISITAVLEVRKESYIVADQDGHLIAGGASTSAVTRRWFDSFDFNLRPIEGIAEGQVNPQIQRTAERIFETDSGIDRRIGDSLHWFRKGIESTRPEDQLISFWIAIETLVGFRPSQSNLILDHGQEERKFRLAQDLISATDLQYFIFDVGFNLYHYISDLLQNGSLTVPLEIVNRCGLKPAPGREIKIDLRPFVRNLAEFSNYVERKIIKDKCTFTIAFYQQNSDTATTEMRNRIRQTKDEVLLIYRYRNKIVHNARFDTQILPYFARRARSHSERLLKRVIDARAEDGIGSIEEILARVRVRTHRILEGVERKALDLLDLPF
jgi:hypothetical protein